MFRLFLTALVVFSFLLSCNSENPEDNSDQDTMTDSSVMDFDMQDLATDNDSVEDSVPDLKTDSDITGNDNNIPDSDSGLSDDTVVNDADELPDETETPDYDYPAGTDGDYDCPSLLNPGFPYEDKDGKITFCRKCDLPAPANDPQCIRNLWEMNNRRIVEEYPDEYCYPLPCDVTDKAIKNDAPTIGKCDFDAESKIYHNSTGVFKQGDIWDGKIGMYAATGKKVDGKYIVIGSLLYEIATKKYTMVSWSTSKQSYKNDRFIFLTGNTYDMKSYLASAKKTDNGWKYEFIYKNEWNSVEFIYPPAVGENYVLINVTRASDSGPKEILYASVNDWNWKKLGEGTIIYSQIHNDKAFFNYDSSVWSCDLTKSPTNIETDCRKVNQEGIQATSPAVKKDNPNLVIYTAEAGYRQLYMANLANAEIVYTKLDLEKSSDLISFAPGQWDGDILALGELYHFSEVDIDYRMCYYSISKDKKVCFPNPNEHQAPMGYVYGGVEGKYITYQPTGAIFLRDMECYCVEYPDQCLYDEYIPETTVLKKK